VIVNVALLVMLLGGCASQPPPSTPYAPGFIGGLLHGVGAPFALVLSFFRDDVRIYSFPNTGTLYDLGFLLGLSTWGGGVAARRSPPRDDAEATIRRLKRKIRRLREEMPDDEM
jgi:hypothetical protein